MASPGILRAATTDGSVEAATRSGRVRGARAGGVCSFKGIPYAGSPAGAGRFKAAPPVTPWTGVRDALQLAAPSIQPPGFQDSQRMPAPSEDCLYLNVWTPACDGRSRPVMFYNHGGGFTSGSGGALAQDGANLAREYDVVVVESNHRLGIMGYLYLGDILGEDYGNQGMLDILAALRWTTDNIGEFGGDPNNVMVFGESGGGAKTTTVYAMPEATRHFAKASIESGPTFRLTPRSAATATARAVLTQLGIAESNARALFDVPAEQLLKVQSKIGGGGGPIIFGAPRPEPNAPAPFAPVIDGVDLPADPFDPVAPPFSAGKPLMIGITSDETVFFNLSDPTTFNLDEAGMRQRLTRMLGANAERVVSTYRHMTPRATPSQLYLRASRDAMMWSSAILIAERKAAQHAAPVFMYELVYPSPTKVPGTDYPSGSPHASDIFMKFDNVPPLSDHPGLFDTDQSAARRRTAKNMSEMWSTFARSSHPGAQGQPFWPAYTPLHRATMFIDSECRVVVDPQSEARLMWEQLRS